MSPACAFRLKRESNKSRFRADRAAFSKAATRNNSAEQHTSRVKHAWRLICSLSTGIATAFSGVCKIPASSVGSCLLKSACTEAIFYIGLRFSGPNPSLYTVAVPASSYAASSTSSSRGSVSASNPAPMPICRPPASSICIALRLADCAIALSTSSTGISETAGMTRVTSSRHMPLGPLAPLRCRLNVQCDRACRRQYPARLRPLGSNPATRTATSARLRRRPSVCVAVLFMHPVQHAERVRQSMVLPECIRWTRTTAKWLHCLCAVWHGLKASSNQIPDARIHWMKP